MGYRQFLAPNSHEMVVTDSSRSVPSRQQRSGGRKKLIRPSRSHTNVGLPKKVRFSNDSEEACERISAETIVYTREDLTKVERRNCYITEEELAAIRQNCKMEAKTYKRTAYVQHYGAVYAAAKDGINLRSIAQDRARVCSSPCRGLERMIIVELGLDRKAVVQSVLRTQAETQNEVTIAASSRCYSKRSRNIARILGHGDAAYVQACRRIEAKVVE